MCGSIFFGVLVGIMALKAARRWMYFRGGCGPAAMRCGHRGACGHGHGPGHGHGHNHDGRFMFYRWSNEHGHGAGFASRTPAARSLQELVRGLELNQRQRDEAAPVLTLIEEWLGGNGPRVDATLLTIASERFEPVVLHGLLSELPEPIQRQLIEGLEHLHTILIPEQKEALRRELTQKKAPASTPPSGTPPASA